MVVNRSQLGDLEGILVTKPVKKYQQVEREKVAQWRGSNANRGSRDRELILSKQTAQRQKALEQKKQAMAKAEEERRKKALEERRQSQREATERCKLAMSRLKGSSRLGSGTSTTHARDIPVEIHLSKHSATVTKPPISKQPSPHPQIGERIVLGSEVELRANPTSERRPPSLDDVLRAIRGQSLSAASPSPHPPPGSSSVRHKGAESATHYSTSNATRFPVYQVNPSLDEDRGNSLPGSERLTRDANFLQQRTEGGSEEEDAVERGGGMVFHPVVRRTPQTRFDMSQDQTDMKIVSPDQVSSSGSSPVDSLSEDETLDSLNPSPTVSPSNGKKQTVRKHRKHPREKKRDHVVDGREEGTVASTTQPSTSHNASFPPHSSSSQYPRYVCDNSSSEDESYHSHPPPPRNRRQHSQRSPPPKSLGEYYHQKKAQTQSQSQGGGPWGEKIVGILKKPTGGNGTGLKNMEDSEGKGKGGEGERSECGHDTAVSSRITSAVPSQAGSATGSALTLEQARQDGCGLVGEITRHSITMSAGTSKRVRFSDQVGSSSATPPGEDTQPAVNILSSVDLWNRIIPQRGYGVRFPPSGVFTPKMKISLSQRGWATSKRPAQTDRITMHAPQAVENVLQAKERQQGRREGKEGGGKGGERGRVGGGGGGGGGEWVRGAKEEEVAQDVAYDSRTGRGKASREATTKDSSQNGNSAIGEENVQQASQSHDQTNVTVATSLERTPTDEEIDRLWDQVQSQLHDRAKVSVVPQVYRFHPDPQIASEQRDGAGGRREDGRYNTRHLPQRAQQRPPRCQGGGGGGHSRSAPVQLWPHSHLSHTRKQAQSHTSASTHPHTASSSPHPPTPHSHSAHKHSQPKTTPTAHPSSWEPRVASAVTPGVTGLSRDEQRLLYSIEKINQRIKNHIATKAPSEHSHHHPSQSHPPHHPHPSQIPQC